MKHLGTQTLTTQRLILRPFTLEDAPAMYRNWAGDPQVTRFLTWPTHESEEASRAIIGSWVPHYTEDNRYEWAIVLKSLGEPIGSLGVVTMDDAVEACEVGYCIGRRWWRQGITGEALGAVLQFLFERVGFNRVQARHDVNNPNSGRVMAHCGMTREGVLRQSARNREGLCDMAVCAILAGEYRKR